MGLTKLANYSDSQTRIAWVARILAHPARVAILEELFAGNVCFCGDIARAVGLAQPTVSQHLNVLKAAGLIRGSSLTGRTCYCLVPEQWVRARRSLERFLSNSLGEPPASDFTEEDPT